jgi:hypothetical protein
VHDCLAAGDFRPLKGNDFLVLPAEFFPVADLAAVYVAYLQRCQSGDRVCLVNEEAYLKLTMSIVAIKYMKIENKFENQDIFASNVTHRHTPTSRVNYGVK